MTVTAVVFSAPGKVGLQSAQMVPPGDSDILVEMSFSGISTGTERLLWQGRMPNFPGLGYPLVPGYESVGRVIEAGAESGWRSGDAVFVPGAHCFADLRPLFGGSAAAATLPGRRAVADPYGDERGVLLALAATARHALAAPSAGPPELVVGHGALGRLVARLAVAYGGSPIVWEHDAARRGGADGAYEVLDPALDERRDYRAIYDCSGDPQILDGLVGRLARGGEIALCGFYAEPLVFAFAPAFMREARLRVAAEWRPDDMAAVRALIDSGQLDLGGIVSHRAPASAAPAAYRRAFTDPDCLKMILDWSDA